MVVARRKNIENKCNDIKDECCEIIVKAYGELKNNEVYEWNRKVCESKIFNNEDFDFNRIQIESPSYDENGRIITNGKKNQLVADASKRDFENVSLVEYIDNYFEREVKSYNPEAWIEESKTKVGYEIPFGWL